jgi:hypothetical protein
LKEIGGPANSQRNHTIDGPVIVASTNIVLQEWFKGWITPECTELLIAETRDEVQTTLHNLASDNQYTAQLLIDWSVCPIEGPLSYLYKLDLDERTSVTILAPLTVHASLQKMASLHGFQLLRMPTSNLAVTEAIGRPVAALQANARALHLTLANGAAEFAENIVHLLPKNKTQDLE